VTVHAILVIYQDQVDAYHAREHSISTVKPASPTAQLGSIHLLTNVRSVILHAILVIKLELMGVSHALDLLISIAKLA
jgi:hypothetical protein